MLPRNAKKPALVGVSVEVHSFPRELPNIREHDRHRVRAGTVNISLSKGHKAGA